MSLTPSVLSIIGLGLERGDLTLKGLEAIKKAHEVFVEDYTSFPYETEFGAKPLPREGVESDFLVNRAMTANIVLLVGGDPLFATTHITLVNECKKKGIRCEIIHAPSVMNAVARTGLSPYKFGRVVTISRVLESDKEKIQANINAKLHTLCLVDPLLPAKDAVAVLRKMGFGMKLVLCEKLGTREEKIRYAVAFEKIGPPPYCILIPGELHFFEEEFLQQFSSTAKVKL
jgi:diphthine synthase